jgi:large-conductance mechanosensitive channel
MKLHKDSDTLKYFFYIRKAFNALIIAASIFLYSRCVAHEHRSIS